MLGVGWASPQQESQGPGCSSRQKDGPSCRGLWMPGWCLLWRRGKAVGSPSGHALGGCGAAALCLLRSQRVCGSSPPPPTPHPPAAVLRGLRSVSHPGHWSCQTRGSDTVLTQDTGVISQTLEAEACRGRKQDCSSRALHPASGTHPHPGEGTGGRR